MVSVRREAERSGFVASDLAANARRAGAALFIPRRTLNIALIPAINSNARPLYWATEVALSYDKQMPQNDCDRVRTKVQFALRRTR
jgi:hypothetical protein